MFEAFPKSQLQIIAPDGTVRSTETGIMSSKSVTIPNEAAVIHVGDEIRRKLPNGIEEAFEVVDPVYHSHFHGIPAHYQVKIRRKGSFPSGTGGHYTVTVSGANARVNIGSHDHSHNIATNDHVFVELKDKIRNEVSDLEERSRLLTLIDTMQKSANDRSSFTTAYQAFISSAANHMTLVAPFLPAITQFLS